MANLEESIVATLFSQKDKTANVVLRHMPFMALLKDKGRYKVRDLGNEIRKPTLYNSTRVGGFYTGYQEFNLDSASDLTAFRMAIKQCYEPFAISGRERRANKNKEQLLNLIDEKMEATMSRLKNTVTASIKGDGTGFGGREFDGLKKAVSTSPTSGTYGQIDRSVASNAWARNVVNNVTLTALNVQEEITETVMPLVRGSEGPDCAIAGATAWKFLHSSLTAIQRINDQSKTGRGGFRELYYDGMKFWFDGGFDGVGGTGTTLGANTCYLLNSDTWTFEVDSLADFVPLAPKLDRPSNQDAFFTVVIVEGNLCCNAPALNAVIYP